jgi:tetratricopeptide (TPR) repeat protein
MQAILLANAASMNEELVHITDEALKQFPDSTDIRFFRGIGLYEKEEFELLVKNFDGISFDDFTEKEYAVQSKMLLAEAFYRNENFGRSDSIFEALIEDDPDNHIVLNNYSYYLAERGEKLELAKEWSYKAIVANPENATFLDTYAWILYKLGEMEEAEKYILKALEKGGNNDPEVNEHAGDIQAKLGSYEVARAYYRKAIILGGDKEELKSKIGMIEAKLDE